MTPERPPVAIYTPTAAIGGVEMVGVRAHRALEAAGLASGLHPGLAGALRSPRPRAPWMALTWKMHWLARLRHPGLRQRGLLWIHGAELNRDTGAALARARHDTLARADRLLAVSPYVFDLLPALRSRITLVGPPIPPPPPGLEPRLEARRESGRPLRLLSVGRAEPRKGHDTAIDVARHLSESGPVRLDVVGPGPDIPRLQARAVPAPDLDVRIHGRVPEEEKDRLFAEADVFLFLTRQEGAEIDGLGLVVLEAGARGCPAVVLDSGGTRFTVADGASGAVIPGDSPVPVIADAAARVAADPAARAAAHRYASQFGLEAWSARLVAAVEGQPIDWAWPSLPPRAAARTRPPEPA